jgi:glycosyltransferase involved in cell wall biosynthesis
MTDLQPTSAKRLVIVPAFNERASVRKVVMRLRRSLPEYDVLVIDDGSTDDTVRQVPDRTAVVTLPFNLGIGGAMQTGYRYAALHGYDVAVQVDADGQHRPAQVRRLVEALEGGADLVVGSRFLIPNRRYRQTPPRKAGAWFLRALIRSMTGLAITDCTSGFRAANRRVIRAFAHWYPEDYPEPEVILLLHRAGYAIREVPVRMRQRHTGRSSINVLEGIFYVLKVTICLLLDLVRDPWPLGRVVEHRPSPGRPAGSPGGGRASYRSDAVKLPEHERGHTQPVLREPAGHEPVQPVAQPVPGGLRWDPPGAGRPTAPHL